MSRSLDVKDNVGEAELIQHRPTERPIHLASIAGRRPPAVELHVQREFKTASVQRRDFGDVHAAIDGRS